MLRSCPENYQILNRPIFNMKTYFNHGNMNCVLLFKVDKDIWLRSVTVVSQSNKSCEELGVVYPCDICFVTEDVPLMYNIGGRGMMSRAGIAPCIPGQRYLVTQAVEDEELNQSRPSGRGRILGGRGQARLGALPSIPGGPRTLEARPPANFFLAEQAPTKYPENIEMSLSKLKYIPEGVHTIQNHINMKFQYNKNYNTLNKLQFPKPILLQKSDDFSWDTGHFYALKLSFLKAGYYEGGDSVEHLRCGDVDFKFNVVGSIYPMVNHGLIRSLEFSSED